jgi:hypothetical protein
VRYQCGIDCHSAHEVRAVKDSLSPVHRLRMAETCGRCHAGQEKMAQYGIPHQSDGRIPQQRTLGGSDQEGGSFGAHLRIVLWESRRQASAGGIHRHRFCGSCHVMYAERLEKRPHQAVFAALGTIGGCIACHSNHAIHQASTAMLTGSNAVCSTCHPAESGPGKAASQMAGWINGLDASLKESETLLARAEEYGMDCRRRRSG